MKLLTKYNNSLGYTIIELLAVISILVIISGVISGILYSALRGSGKTRITTDISQNGNYAMSVISNIIIDSASVTQIDGVDISDCTASPSGSSITLKRLDGSYTSLSCSGATIASNSASLINTNEVQIEEGSCVFSCMQGSLDSYSVPVVGVTFTIRDKDSGTFESQGSAVFNNSISLRNFSP